MTIMLLYHNHRFHCNGISFEIPDGFYLETAPGTETEDKICLYSPDQEYDLGIGVERDCASSADELAICMRESRVIEPITPVVVNGISGHHAVYGYRRDQYYELRLDIDDGFLFTFVIHTNDNILDYKDRPEILAAIQVVRMDE